MAYIKLCPFKLKISFTLQRVATDNPSVDLPELLSIDSPDVFELHFRISIRLECAVIELYGGVELVDSIDCSPST